MTPDDAIRFLAHEAERCRSLAWASEDRRDLAEMLCLWLPPLLKIFKLDPPDDMHAIAFQDWAHKELRWLTQRGATGAATEGQQDTGASEEINLANGVSKLAPVVPADVLRAAVHRLVK